MMKNPPNDKMIRQEDVKTKGKKHVKNIPRPMDEAGLAPPPPADVHRLSLKKVVTGVPD